MKRLVIIVAIAILLIGLVLLGLSDTVLTSYFRRPSEADVEEAVLKDIAGEIGMGVFHNYYQWVTEVEVIEYGEPYIPPPRFTRMGLYTIWPVKVYFIGDQQESHARVCVTYLGAESAEWLVMRCLPRS